MLRPSGAVAMGNQSRIGQNDKGARPAWALILINHFAYATSRRGEQFYTDPPSELALFFHRRANSLRPFGSARQAPPRWLHPAGRGTLYGPPIHHPWNAQVVLVGSFDLATRPRRQGHRRLPEEPSVDISDLCAARIPDLSRVL